MKVSSLFFVVFILAVSAQRRPSIYDADFEATSHKPAGRSRDRTRFSLTPEYEQANAEFKSEQKTLEIPTTRRKPERNQPIGENRRTYEVREVIDDVPLPKIKKKSHVITETKFEATNAPKKEAVVPSPIPPEELITIPNKPEQEPVAQPSTEKTPEVSAAPSSTEPPKAEPDVKRKIPERHGLRITPHVQQRIDASTRIRTRPKPLHREEPRTTTVSPSTTRSHLRSNRRRLDNNHEIKHNALRTRGPSVFSAEIAADLPTRPRPGRRVNTNIRENEAATEEAGRNTVVLRRRKPSVEDEENTTANIPRRDSSRSRQTVRVTPEPTRNVAYAPRRSDITRGRTVEVVATTSTLRPRRVPASPSQTLRSRNRVKSENVESVVTNPTRGVWSRRRPSSDGIDDIDAASTKQTEVKIKVDSLNKENQNVKVSLESSFSEETQTTRIRKRPHFPTRKSNHILEPNSDVTDEPSKIALLNLRTSEDRGPKVSVVGRPRGRTSGKKLNGEDVSRSQEVIEETDNYPAPFKAALKAKKQQGLLGSRIHNVNEAFNSKTTEATTSSIPSTSLKTFPYPTAVASSAVTKNEETSTSRLPKYTRSRFSLTTKQPKSDDAKETRRYNPERPKYSPAENAPKFHARYKSIRTQTTEDESAKPRTYIPKPPKGIYSSRKFFRSTTNSPEVSQPSKFSLETVTLSTKAPSVGLSAKNRFSARYRNEILPKSSSHRGSTLGPSYIPTVPTVTPSSSTIKIEDRIQGLEVISIFDQASNTLQSANLISEMAARPEETSTASSTEKTVSIIERIINSITAISTTTSPDTTVTKTTTTGQTTKNSAILSLVSKRQNLDPAALTTDSDFKTTEKPTTIIEQILSSLSAIKADTETENTTPITTQVGSSTTDTMTSSLINSEQTSLSDGSTTSTASVSSTALFTDFTSTVAPSEEQNTIPFRVEHLQPRFLSETTSTFNPQTTEEQNTMSSRTENLQPRLLSETTSNPQTTETITVDRLLALLNTTTSEANTPRATTFLGTSNESDETTPMLFTSEIEEELTTIPITDTTQTPTVEEISSSTEAQSKLPTETTFKLLVSTVTGPYPAPTTEPSTSTTAVQQLTTTPDETMKSSSASTEDSTISSSPSTLQTVTSSETTSSVSSSTLFTSGPYPFALSTSGSKATEPTVPTPFLTSGPYSKEVKTEPTSTESSTLSTNTITDSTTASLFPYPGSTASTDPVGQSSTVSEVTVRYTKTASPTTADSDSSTLTTPEGSSTIPTVSRFEVSPDRVTIYSPNDVSNTFVSDDMGSTTVSIAARGLTLAPIVTTITTTKPYPNSQPPTTTVTTTTNTIDETTQDVSSNTINTNSVTDKSSVSNLINSLSASTNAPQSGGTTTRKSLMMEVTNREGKRLTFELMNPPNDISNSDESQKDYFIFAVLQNNTILRKRPSRFPNKKIPFLIYGLLPNNTLVQKFPNGTVVPMEPVIQVNGFDTRENPPPPPELISNQVTGIEDSQRNSKKLTVDVEDRIQANQLSSDSQIGSKPNLPPVVELLGGKTIEAFSNIMNKTQEEQSSKVKTLDVDPMDEKTTETTTVSPTTTQTTTTTTTPSTTTSAATTTTTTSTPTPTTEKTTEATSTEAILFTSPQFSQTDVDVNALAIVTTQPPVNLIDLLTTTLKVPSLKDIELNKDRLTDQQKQDLAILRSLEEEQRAILKQLQFLSGLNLKGTGSRKDENLANRVIAQAVENSKAEDSKNAVVSTVNDLIRQINTVTPTNPVVSSTYGKTNDALLASLLKEYGVGPTTPKGFSDAFTKELLTTTKAPTRKTTTQAPGPLMQGLNWLLNTLAPQPTTKPKPKPTTTPKLDTTSQPTTAVPVIARFEDSQPKKSSITDKQLEALIGQLEAIQKDPSKAQTLDIDYFKKLKSNEVSSPRPTVQTTTNFVEAKPVTKQPIRIAPVKLNPVPGVPEEGPVIRGQLVNYAINITKAISSFLGSALQGAASTFQSFLGSVSRPDRNFYNSNSSNRPG